MEERHIGFAAVQPKNGTITIPAALRREYGLDKPGAQVEVIVRDGEIVLVPHVAVPADEAWFWSKEWQEKEREADEDIAAGRTIHHDSVDELLTHLERVSPSDDDGPDPAPDPTGSWLREDHFALKPVGEDSLLRIREFLHRARRSSSHTPAKLMVDLATLTVISNALSEHEEHADADACQECALLERTVVNALIHDQDAIIVEIPIHAIEHQTADDGDR